MKKLYISSSVKKIMFFLIAIVLPFFTIRCSKTEATPPPPPPVIKPTIASFTPTSGTTGTEITINGTKLTGVTAVSFGGVAAASFSVVNDKTITAVVGTGSSGNVVVSSPSGNAMFSGFSYNNVTVTTCKLPHASASTAIGIGFPVRPYRTPSTKSVKVAVIFVDFY